MAVTQTPYITGVKNAPEPNDGSVWYTPFDILLPATLSAMDLIELMPLHPGVFVQDFSLQAPQLDSNGTPTLSFSLGIENQSINGTQYAFDGTLSTVLETGITVGRGAKGSVYRMVNGDVPTVDRAMAQVAQNSRRLCLRVDTVAATPSLAGKTITMVLGTRH